MDKIKLRFSINSSYVATFDDKVLQIFELMQLPEENEADNVKLIKHMEDMEFKMDDAYAYDKISEVFIDENDIQDSWLVLTS